MCRNFHPDPLPPEMVVELCDQARRAPSAGNSQAVEFCIVADPERYWSLTLPAERREQFSWPGLLVAPVLVVVLTEPERYVERYSEPDKAHTGLGDGPDSWSVPFWWVDAGMAVQSLLTGAAAAGLDTCFFGVFAHEAAVLSGLGIPAGRRIVGTVALGYGADDNPPGRSASRARRPLGEIVRWAN